MATVSSDTPRDWRREPRKPADQLAKRTVTIRLTEAEYAALKSAAREAGLTLRQLILARCI